MADFPLNSLRQFLVPNATLQVKTFAATTLIGLEKAVADWVHQTKNVVVVPGPITQSATDYLLAVSFLPAKE